MAAKRATFWCQIDSFARGHTLGSVSKSGLAFAKVYLSLCQERETRERMSLQKLRHKTGLNKMRKAGSFKIRRSTKLMQVSSGSKDKLQ